MKELSSLDLHYLVKEFQVLVDSKIDQIYQPPDMVVIRVHSPNTGKKILRFTKSFAFISDFKGQQPMHPPTFCMTMRKHISGCRVREITQVGFERILRFRLEKDKTYYLYSELFSKGNLILTDDSGKILSSWHVQKDKRFVKKGEMYQPPNEKGNAFEMKESEFKEFLRSSENSLVKALAIDFGFGGFYSEYLLRDFDKDIMPSEVKSKDVKKLYERIQSFKDREIKPSKLDDRIMPFSGGEELNYDSFNAALEEDITEELKKEEEEKRLAPYLEKKKKLENIISKQDKSIKKMEKDVKENQEKGEKIYENYQYIQNIMDEIRKAKEKYGWAEVKKKLKNHSVVKQVNEKDGKITIEID